MMKNDKRPRTLPAMLTALTVALAAAGMGATAQAASVTDEDILKDAELAMYHAKRIGGDRIEVFKPAMRARKTASPSSVTNRSAPSR